MPRPRLAAVASIFALVVIEARAQDPAPAKPALPITRSEFLMPPELAAKLPKLGEILPQPVSIPEPPPHEGAMADIPYSVDVPDILAIDVVNALPGRPISGEYLVRSDGTISLGIYGKLHVRGLTLDQIKLKLLLHLRTYLTDSALGLIAPVEDAARADFYALSPTPMNGQMFDPDRVELPALPAEPARRLDAPPAVDKLPTKAAPNPLPRPRTSDRVAPGTRRRSTRVTARLGTKRQLPKVQVPADAAAAEYKNPMRLVPSEVNFHLSVDVRVYNSRFYYVDGDVGLAGRFPSQGNETVLDAITHAGGLSPTAEPRSISLYRPGRGGMPARVYAIDLAKIKAGEATLNYQLFPGDRLIVERNKVVEVTTQVDRLTGPLNSLLNHWLTYAFTMRAIANMDQPYAATAPQVKLGDKSPSMEGPGPATPAATMNLVRRDYLDMVKKLADPNLREIKPEALGEALTKPSTRGDEPRPKP